MAWTFTVNEYGDMVVSEYGGIETVSGVDKLAQEVREVLLLSLRNEPDIPASGLVDVIGSAESYSVKTKIYDALMRLKLKQQQQKSRDKSEIIGKIVLITVKQEKNKCSVTVELTTAAGQQTVVEVSYAR